METRSGKGKRQPDEEESSKPPKAGRPAPQLWLVGRSRIRSPPRRWRSAYK
jgi:hypothetical protein